jgi:predicted nucleic acid-binding protein
VSRVFWDTNLFVYLLEDFGELSERVAGIRQHMLARGDQLCTSTLTLGEVLVKPLEAGDTALVIPFDGAAARTFARFRADRSLKPPDAIQLACAAQANTDLFITNDDRLARTVAPGVQFIVSLARAPL